ncbi:MAG: tRNA pseudouridine(38-40) synthase TruA [Candidatus Lambdaproteobacteria bacterium]|nr:tRNA pseudouridine(38-40) synthase TruA [Candidatus Lambdaproteobacteria bacterium]
MPPAPPRPADAAPRRPPRPAPAGQNIAMLLAYDGTPFQGWQLQHHAPSVQGTLEQALRTVLRHPVRVTGSGRTDTGVHALNQVANFRLPVAQDLARLQQHLNGLAGPAIAVKALIPVPDTFHARHSARGKLYRYHVFNRAYPPVFARRRAWWLKLPLDIAAMREAAAWLPGEHDFSAFRAADCAAASPVRHLRRLALAEGEWEDGTLRIELEASGFLQHMARIIVGTLVAVGQGRLAPGDVRRILESRRREQADATAPGHGLHLVRVFYDLGCFPELAAAGFPDAPSP